MAEAHRRPRGADPPRGGSAPAGGAAPPGGRALRDAARRRGQRLPGLRSGAPARQPPRRDPGQPGAAGGVHRQVGRGHRSLRRGDPEDPRGPAGGRGRHGPSHRADLRGPPRGRGQRHRPLSLRGRGRRGARAGHRGPRPALRGHRALGGARGHPPEGGPDRRDAGRHAEPPVPLGTGSAAVPERCRRSDRAVPGDPGGGARAPAFGERPRAALRRRGPAAAGRRDPGAALPDAGGVEPTSERPRGPAELPAGSLRAGLDDAPHRRDRRGACGGPRARLRLDAASAARGPDPRPHPR